MLQFAGFLVLALAIGIPMSLPAESGDVIAEDALSRATFGTNRPGAAHMTIQSIGGETVTLTGFSTDPPVIHRSAATEQGTMSMSPDGKIPIALNASLVS